MNKNVINQLPKLKTHFRSFWNTFSSANVIHGSSRWQISTFIQLCCMCFHPFSLFAFLLPLCACIITFLCVHRDLLTLQNTTSAFHGTLQRRKYTLNTYNFAVLRRSYYRFCLLITLCMRKHMRV